MSEDKAVVAVVTGATRGVGKGVAVELGAAGATVYVTGRSTSIGEPHPLGGSVEETAALVTGAGGHGVPIACDHQRDDQVARVFEDIGRAEKKIDVLVNNVTAIPRDLAKPGPFWEKSIGLARMLDVGLRTHYVATHCAAPLLLASDQGLVAFTSSYGARCYMHGPAYGAGKAGVDKMAMDMAVDFRPHDVSVVSLWLGFVRTERNAPLFDHPRAAEGPYGEFLANAESPRFIGRVIGALRESAQRMDYSGRVLIAAEVAQELGVTESDGRQPRSSRHTLAEPPSPSPVIIR
ncbi:MAG: SDR family NAD(P)-dependent oxidoreductase [Myxococcota bacterium]